MQNDITTLRKQIDTIDEQLLSLINERASLAIEIGDVKNRIGGKTYDPTRERFILEQIDDLNKGPLDKGAVEEIFATIITACREIQIRERSNSPR